MKSALGTRTPEVVPFQVKTRSALLRCSGFHPGRLAQGPEENSGRAGRMAGFCLKELGGVFIAMSPILADRQRPVGRAWPAGERPAFWPECKRKFCRRDRET